MKSETETPSLSEIGEWPRVQIGSHSVIRHAYENVLTACARLGSFATGREPTTDGPVGRQQELLAVDDLVGFAIHARRLIENTASSKRFRGVGIGSAEPGGIRLIWGSTPAAGVITPLEQG